MALKAYKHLTDGEVKIVASGSAEETSLLADTVKGASYLELTSTGHAQEVSAAQGTALWVDVTSDLGSGGGSSAQVFEVTDLLIPSGTDWSSGVGHQIGALADGLHYSKFNLFELFIELADIPDDDILIDVLDDPDFAAYSAGAYLTIEAGGTRANSNNGVTGLEALGELPAPSPHVAAAWKGALIGFTGQPLYIGLHTNGVTTADITVVRARASFLVI